MIRDFKQKIIARSGPEGLKTDDEKTKWLTEQDWYQAKGSEYCKCFEKYEHKEYGRQRYIETIIKDATPSFGYVVLANLMAVGRINTVITTNFDDLIYSACSIFTGIRPIVYAYGLLAAEMRFASQHRKILKLHGDYLYSRLKNTNEETAVQDPNMERQLRQTLNEYGLIVVGYSGGDDSLIKVFSDIPRENDLYWCIRRGEKPNEAVEKLLREKDGFLIEIDGFDEMMNEIRRVVAFDVKKMLDSIDERRNEILKHFEKFEPQYLEGIPREIAEAKKEPDTKPEEDRRLKALDLFSKAYQAQKAKNLSKAEELYRKAIELNPNYAFAYNNLGVLLNELKRYDEAEVAYRKVIELDSNVAGAYYNLSNMLRALNRDAEALTFAMKANELAPDRLSYLMALAAIHKKLGHQAESNQYIAQARELIKPDDWYDLACIESVCGNAEAAIENLRRAAQENKLDPDWAKRDPDLEWIRDDPRFKEIVGEEGA
jgi:tetratricopeptide (TPR) repeat protein